MPEDRVLSRPFDEMMDAAQSWAIEERMDWLVKLKAESRKRYEKFGWPHAKTESWKYTNLNILARQPFSWTVNSSGQVPMKRTTPIDGPRLVLVNGRLRFDESNVSELGPGINLRRLTELTEQDQKQLSSVLEEKTCADGLPLAALSTVTMSDALILDIADGHIMEKPIHLISVGVGTDVGFASHVLIRVGVESAVNIIESHVGDDKFQYFSNNVTQVSLSRGARVGHYKIQNESKCSFHIGLTVADLSEYSKYDNFTFSIGARLARNEIRGFINEPNAEYRINGAYIGSEKQHLDNTTFIQHDAPNTKSREIYKGILFDEAHGVFQGKILVKADAQGTDGFQMNRAMLLSEKAEINTKPELEIYADDVRCSHGATVGELDEEQLFYLQSRGLGPAEARSLLVAAYINDVINEIQEPDVCRAFKDMAADWLDDNIIRNGK